MFNSVKLRRTNPRAAEATFPRVSSRFSKRRVNTTLTITMISVVAATMSLMARQNDNAPNSEMPMLVSEVSVPSDLKGKLAQVTRAEGAQQEMEAMDLLFCGASDGDIDVLRHQAHVGVALRAAWEQLCHTLPEGELWMDFEKPSVRHFLVASMPIFEP